MTSRGCWPGAIPALASGGSSESVNCGVEEDSGRHVGAFIIMIIDDVVSLGRLMSSIV